MIAGCLAAGSLKAQAPKDQRALSTRIADLLQQLPSAGKDRLNANMQEISALGEPGITELVTMLSPEGKGDNTRLQYAIGGYAGYIMQPGKEQERAAAVRAYTKALPKLSNDELRDFLIGQLQLIGNDEAVAPLSTYLKSERLADPAARALAVINTPAAQKALVDALASAKGKTLVTLAEALGDCRSAAAVTELNKLATSNNQQLRKVALYSLARIGAPESADILAKQAAQSGYTFDYTNATASYLSYLQKTADIKRLQELWRTTNKPGQVHTHTAAFTLLATLQPDKNKLRFPTELTHANAQYRAAAMKVAANYKTDEYVELYTFIYKKANTDVKAGLLSLLAATGNKAAIPVITAAIKDKAVQLPAIEAAGRTGDGTVVPALLDAMKSNDTIVIDAAKQALMTIKSEQLPAQVAAALPAATPAAQVALINVLGARRAGAQVPAIWPLLKSDDVKVSKAAYQAVAVSADASQLPQLFAALAEITAPGQQLTGIQRGIANALATTPQNEAVTRVAAEMKKAPADRRGNYLPILSLIGGKEALNIVIDAYRSGGTKPGALAALATWKDGSAIYPLIEVMRKDQDGAIVIDGTINMISTSGWTAEQKFLALREIMELTKTNAQRSKILKEIDKCKTFPALIFAGQYLDNNALQADAANVVMDIALSNKNFNGANVKAMLEKASKLLKSGDADYQREAIRKHLAEMPAGEGPVAIFNGKDLSGWKGLVGNPITRAKMTPKQLAAAQQKADSAMVSGWSAKDGLLVFNGHGDNLCTTKPYGDFEMFVDWKITPEGDAGIYLRGTPQVQIWDTSRVSVGAQVGSGGLYNNQKNPSKPLKVADNAIGEWNNFHIIMQGDRVTVYLNGVLVTDNTILENYWDRNLPIFPEEQLELQAHGTYVAYRDIYVRELPRPKPYSLTAQEKRDGYEILFDGTNMHKWTGNTTDYVMENGDMVIYPKNGGKGNLYTKKEYANFIYRFEFQLTPGANNGLGIRTPMEGDAAYVGMELQILDNEAEIYKKLQPYQYHGSVYGIIPAKRGYLKPVGEWNYEEVIADGNRIKVILNGTVILDGDIAEASKNNTEPADHKKHPGLLNKSGHIGFLGHGAEVRFRNIRIKELPSK